MALDVDAIRARIPALKSGSARFDAPGGTQTPQPVIDAVAEALSRPLANRGRTTEGERNADGIVTRARGALADLLGADPRGVVFGRSATQLTYDLSRTLARTWGPGDEVVVTRLDHDSN
ncbi:aminotransferase class V-fold PLP-dependent enzyme, partial [Streptomyces sp. SID625]|nr:aminotransferase class V-fold PLP-dependent enzyme [Streptomyces sp. SID625]